MEKMDWEDNYMTPPKVLSKPAGKPEPKMSEYTQAYFKQISPKTLEEVCQVAEAVANENEDSEDFLKSPVVGYSFSSDDEMSNASSDTDPVLDELNRMAFNTVVKADTPNTKARNKERRKRVNKIIKLREKEEEQEDEDRILGEISTCALATTNQPNKNSDSSKSIPKPGFSTVSAKSIAESTEAIKKVESNRKETVKEVSVNTLQIGYTDSEVTPVAPEDIEMPQDDLKSMEEEEDDFSWPTMPPMPTMLTKGLSTASGKNVSVSTDSIKKVRNLWKNNEGKNSDVVERNPNETLAPEFATTTGKNISVSTEAIKKVQKLRENLEINNDDFIRRRTNVAPGLGGRGKNTSVLTEARKKEQKLLEFIEASENDLIEIKPTAAPGFTTASGKNISVSKEAVKKCQKLWKNTDVIVNDFIMPNSTPGFATASEKNISVSEESLKKRHKLMENTEVNENYLLETKPNTASGFSAASGKNTFISEESLKKRQKLMENTEVNENNFIERQPNTALGFSAASGKNTLISEESLKKRQKLMENIEVNENDFIERKPNITSGIAASEINTSVSEESLKKRQKSTENIEVNENDFIERKPNTAPRFATPIGKNTSASAEVSKKEQKLLEFIEGSKNDFIEIKPNTAVGFATASGKNISISEASLKKRQKLMENIEDNQSDFIDRKPNTARGFGAAIGKNTSVSTEARKKEQKLLEFIEASKNDFIEIKPNTAAGFATASGKNIPVSEKSIKKRQKLMENIEVNENDFIGRKSNTAPGFATAIGKNTLVSTEARKKEQKLLEFIEASKNDFIEIKPDPETVKNISVSMEELKKDSDVWKNSEVKDNIFVESKPKVGPGFSTAGGKNISVKVESVKEVQKLWEKKKPETSEDLRKCALSPIPFTSGKISILSPETVVETKIEETSKEDVSMLDDHFECDKLGDLGDGSSMAFKADEIGKEIEDSVTALLADEENDQLLQDDPEEQLKTEVPASGDSKDCVETRPDKISLITYDQKTVALINVYLARIYPSIYINKNTEGKTVILSQKQFESQQKKQDAENDAEKIYAEIEKDVRQQYSNKSDPKKCRLSSLNKNTLNKMPPDSILDLMEGSDDITNIESMLSPGVFNEVQNAKILREDSIRSAIQSQFETQRKKLMAGQPSQVVKLLVLDTSTCGDVSDAKNCAFISLWKPPETLLSSLKEGDTFEISNLTTNSKLHQDIIQLNTTVRTQFQAMDMSTEIFRKTVRICHAISDVISPNFSALFKEIDVVGLVVSVRPVVGNSGQLVYISDENNNFLAIRFWNSITDQLLDDVLQQGTFLSIFNLQWRVSSPKSFIPTAFFQETSIFKTNPKESIMCAALNTLKSNIQNPKSFASSSEMILFSRLDSRLSTGNSSFNTSFVKDSARTPQTPAFSVGNNASFNVTPTGSANSAKRMKLLQSYGNPPPIPQLTMVTTPRASKKFVPPLKKS